MVEFIKKYYVYIIGALFALLCLQTCRSCTKGNNQVELSQKIDSLEENNREKVIIIDSLKSVVKQDSIKIESLQITVGRLEGDKSYLQESNNKLNSNLKKSLDKNEKSE